MFDRSVGLWSSAPAFLNSNVVTRRWDKQTDSNRLTCICECQSPSGSDVCVAQGEGVWVQRLTSSQQLVRFISITAGREETDSLLVPTLQNYLHQEAGLQSMWTTRKKLFFFFSPLTRAFGWHWRIPLAKAAMVRSSISVCRFAPNILSGTNDWQQGGESALSWSNKPCLFLVLKLKPEGKCLLRDGLNNSKHKTFVTFF